MTVKQEYHFNLMLATLKRLNNGYMSPKQLRKNAEKLYGLEYEEVIEMAYENMQAEVKAAIKGIKPISKQQKAK